MKHKIAAILLLALLPLLSGCSKSDDADTLNQYETVLVGFWQQTGSTDGNTLYYRFLSNRVGGFFVGDGNGKEISSQTFYWSANSTKLNLKAFGTETAIPYTLKDNNTVLILSANNGAQTFIKTGSGNKE